jgi:TP901 family phage tail tape measure protein
MAGSARQTTVVLTAQVAGYLSGFEQAANATKKTAAESAKLEQQLQKQHAAMGALGAPLFALGAVAAAGVAIAVKAYADFDQQMSAVQAATHETADNMALLRDASIEAGASTSFSATEAASAIEELSKAGVSTRDILGGGLKGSLDLAAAGGLEVGAAAEIAATAMTQFGQAGSKVPHIADLLAAGAGKAQGSVDDLSQALNQGGLVASQAGFSIEETTGTLAAFAAAGLTGSDAGTSLKTAILALQNPSTKAAETMKQYGLEVYNADGTMKSFSEIAGVLKTGLGGLTDEQRNAALATVFGNDAVRSANVLYANGADGITTWTGKVNDAGYAAETAAIKQDNLAGDLEKLGGAFDTLLIKTGSAADGPLRAVVQSVTDLVDSFSDAPQIVQSGALAFGVVTAAVSLVGGAILVAVPKVYELKVALDVLATSSMPGVAGAAGGLTSAIGKSGAALKATAAFLTGPWGVALVAATVGAKLLTDYLDSLKASTEDFQNQIATGASADDLFKLADQGRLISYLGDATKSAEQFQGKLDKITNSDFGTGLDLSAQQLKQSLKEIGDELAVTAETDLPSAQEAFRNLASDMELNSAQQSQLLDSMPALKSALQDQATAAGLTDDATTLLTLAQGTAADQAAASAADYIEQSDAVDKVAQAVTDLLDQFNEMNGVNQDAVSANADFQASLAGISEEVQKQKDAYEQANGSLTGFNLSLDESTVSGSANAASLSSVAQSAQDAALAQYNVDVTTMGAKAASDKYMGTLAEQRAKFDQSATAAGYNADQVKALGDKVFALPSAKNVEITAETAGAQAELDRWITLNNGRVVNIRTVNNVSEIRTPGGVTGSTQANGSVLDFYANGGMSENHVAQIAPAGAWRVWAEPETGGEVYIPLAPSKRERSLDIWREAGKRLNAYADGGLWAQGHYMTAQSAGMSVGDLNPSFTVNVQAKGGVDLLKYVDVSIQRADQQGQMSNRMGKQIR